MAKLMNEWPSTNIRYGELMKENPCFSILKVVMNIIKFNGDNFRSQKVKSRDHKDHNSKSKFRKCQNVQDELLTEL